ncbi:MAG: hypothetical protein GY941_23485 [Planctomycetes bacterium]|nr:hypothetical protein [Planctomycetota bacterium]
MKTKTMKEYGWVVINQEKPVTLSDLYSHGTREDAEKEATRLSTLHQDTYFCVLELLSRTLTMDAIAHEDIDDYGRSTCCLKGRMKYSGGSRYTCDYCGVEEIRTTGLLTVFKGEI